MDKIIGIGGFAVSGNGSDKIKTYALATCVAVTAYSAAKKAAGMVHIALPSATNESEQVQRPGYYASTAVELLVEQLCLQYGCDKGELKISMYGGADSRRKDDLFKIGPKNIEAVKQQLGKLKLRVDKADIGGTVSRTLEMDVATGHISVTMQPLLL